MKKSRKFISMPIISLEEGIQIGTVRNLIIDSAKMEIAAIFIDQRGWFREQKIIPYSRIRSIGDDAITIDQSANVQRSFSLPEILRLIKEKADPIGVRVITEKGTVLGVVDEYYADEKTGKIVSLEISGKFLESLFKGRALLSTTYVRTMGSDIIVVANDAEEGLEKVDGGLQETISTLKEGTSTLFESTLSKTKEISKNLKERYDHRMKQINAAKEAAKESADPTDSKEHDDSVPPEEVDVSSTITSEVKISTEEILPEIKDEAAELLVEAPAEADPVGKK